MNDAKDLLRRLSAADEGCLRTILAPSSDPERVTSAVPAALDRRIRALVRLGALIAVDAPTTSLRWAVELAVTAGADDDAIVGALVAAAPAAGAAQVVAMAPRLALALGFETAVED
jgi:alkylhydroperoxidase/carboxymuconolactone decarboxylase family protein YurZ